MKKFEFTPVLGWSLSRYDTFINCKRQYYYQYYGKYDTEVNPVQIEKLKGLSSTYFEIGTIVHDCIARLLQKIAYNPKEPVSLGEFLKYAGCKIEESIETKEFSEVHFAKKNSIEFEDLYPLVRQSLINFFNSNRYLWLLDNAISYSNEWVIEPPYYGETRINGFKAYCKVDFLSQVGETMHIFDWKTGKPKERQYSAQLQAYAAWAAYHYEKDLNQIKPTIAYLQPKYQEAGIQISELEIEHLINRVHRETMEMYEYCSNVEENIPVDKSSFIMTENKNICRYCNYRELCI